MKFPFLENPKFPLNSNIYPKKINKFPKFIHEMNLKIYFIIHIKYKYEILKKKKFRDKPRRYFYKFRSIENQA